MASLTLDEIIEKLKSPSKTEEELLREESPALQDAWEKYQIVLKMVKASKPKIADSTNILDQIRKRNAASKASRNKRSKTNGL